MISWLLATNHCAFGLMKPTEKAASEHSRCCRGKAAPAKDAPADGVQECCKSIQAAPVPAKVEAKLGAAGFQVPLLALLRVLDAESAGRRSSAFAFDHGPPRAVSFAESVLQRSLLSHAPPFAV